MGEKKKKRTREWKLAAFTSHSPAIDNELCSPLRFSSILRVYLGWFFLSKTGRPERRLSERDREHRERDQASFSHPTRKPFNSITGRKRWQCAKMRQSPKWKRGRERVGDSEPASNRAGSSFFTRAFRERVGNSASSIFVLFFTVDDGI